MIEAGPSRPRTLFGDASMQSDEKRLRLAVCAKDPVSLALYESLVRTVGASPYGCLDVQGLFETLKRIPSSGVLVDQPTLVRLSGVEAGLVRELLALYPHLRLKADKTRGLVEAFTPDGPREGLEAIKDFLFGQCLDRVPRVVRRWERRNLPHNVLLLDALDCDGRVEKSFFANVSPLGAFVFSSLDRRPGETCSLRFAADPELTLKARVIHVVGFGEREAVPGAGVVFLDVGPERRKLLSRLLG